MNCFLFTPEFDQETAQAVLDGVEQTLPTPSVQYRVERTGELDFNLHTVELPAAWMSARALITGRSSFLCNGRNDDCVAVSAKLMPAGLIVGGEQVFETVIDVPDAPRFITRVPDLIRTLARTSVAHYATATPQKAALAIIDGVGNHHPWPAGVRFRQGPARSPTMPAWANFWSLEACHNLGFKPDSNHRALFAQIDEIPERGWYLQLTDNPLDLEVPAHLAQLEALYKALPELARTDWS